MLFCTCRSISVGLIPRNGTAWSKGLCVCNFDGRWQIALCKGYAVFHPHSHMWESGKSEGSNLKVLEGGRSHWSCPHVRYFPFEGTQRKMPSASGFHSMGRQCSKMARATDFAVIQTCVWIPALLLTGYGSLGKSLSLSVSISFSQWG